MTEPSPDSKEDCTSEYLRLAAGAYPREAPRQPQKRHDSPFSAPSRVVGSIFIIGGLGLVFLDHPDIPWSRHPVFYLAITGIAVLLATRKWVHVPLAFVAGELVVFAVLAATTDAPFPYAIVCAATAGIFILACWLAYRSSKAVRPE